MAVEKQTGVLALAERQLPGGSGLVPDPQPYGRLLGDGEAVPAVLALADDDGRLQRVLARGDALGEFPGLVVVRVRDGQSSGRDAERGDVPWCGGPRLLPGLDGVGIARLEQVVDRLLQAHGPRWAPQRHGLFGAPSSRLRPFRQRGRVGGRPDSELAPVVPPLLFRNIGQGVERSAVLAAFLQHLPAALTGEEFHPEPPGIRRQVGLLRCCIPAFDVLPQEQPVVVQESEVDLVGAAARLVVDPLPDEVVTPGDKVHLGGDRAPGDPVQHHVGLAFSVPLLRLRPRQRTERPAGTGVPPHGIRNRHHVVLAHGPPPSATH